MLLRLVAYLVATLCAPALAANPPLTLDVVTEDLPPYQVVVNGRLAAGTAYLQVKAMLDNTPYRYKFQVLPWPRAVKVATNTPNTLIFSIARTADREHQFHWIGPLVPMQYYFYSAHKGPKIQITDPRQALAYSTVSVRDSVEAQRLLALGFVEGENLTLVGDYLAAWGMVYHQRAQLTYANAPSNSFLARVQISAADFVAVSPAEYGEPLYIAASLDTPAEVVTQLRNSLRQIPKQP